jgi:beta-N-acetylhexosaminidase
MFGADPETVVKLAGAFIRGLHETGTAGCLKHFPGLGLGTGDPHYESTVMDFSHEDLMRRDLVPFTRLGNETGAIMIGHGTYPQIDDPNTPATLSRRLTRGLLDAVGFHGLAVSDDMEMHAVSDLGPYELLVERAAMAGSDVILFCSNIERVPGLQRYIDERIQSNQELRARLAEARTKAEGYRDHIGRLRQNARPPANSFDEVTGEAVRFIDKLEKTRPHHAMSDADPGTSGRVPGRGRTGREEWT